MSKKKQSKMFILIEVEIVQRGEEIESVIDSYNISQLRDAMDVGDIIYGGSNEVEEKIEAAVIEWCENAAIGDTIELPNHKHLICIGTPSHEPNFWTLTTHKVEAVDVQVRVRTK